VRNLKLRHLPEKVFDSARITAMLTYKSTVPDSPHPVIRSVSKNHGFRALYLARRTDEFRFYRLINTKIIFLKCFCCWHLPEKFVVCLKKIMALPESGGRSPSSSRLVSLRGRDGFDVSISRPSRDVLSVNILTRVAGHVVS